MKQILIPLIALTLLVSLIRVKDSWGNPINLVVFLVFNIALIFACVWFVKLLERKNKKGDLVFTRQHEKKKLDTKQLMWTFAVLYLLILVSLLALGRIKILPDWLGVFRLEWKGSQPLFFVLLLGIMLVTQGVFIFAGGKIQLQRPMKRWKLFIPVFIASFFLTVLIMCAMAAFGDAADIRTPYPAGNIFKGLFILNWLFWLIVLFIKYKSSKQVNVLKGLVSNVLSGSILSLIIAIPAHIYVKRSSGCFVGMWTSSAVSIGIVVALWAFGPGILILFLEETKRISENK